MFLECGTHGVVGHLVTAIASDLDQELVKILIAKVLRALPKFALEIAAQVT